MAAAAGTRASRRALSTVSEASSSEEEGKRIVVAGPKKARKKTTTTVAAAAATAEEAAPKVDPSTSSDGGSSSNSEEDRRRKTKSGAELEEARRTRDAVKMLLLRSENKVSKDLAAEVICRLDRLVDIVCDVELRYKKLEGIVTGIHGEKRMKRKEEEAAPAAAASAGGTAPQGKRNEVVNEKLSFRDAVRGLQERSRERPVIIVRPKGEETTEELKKRVVKEVSLVKEGVRVREIRPLRKPGVAVEVATMEEATRAAASEQWTKVGARAEVEKPRRPFVVVHDVDEEETARTLVRGMYALNRSLWPTVEAEAFARMVQARRTFRGRFGRNDWLLEVDPQVYRPVVEKGTVLLEWGSCRVRDYVPLTKCYRCGTYGHIGRECSEKRDVCFRCGVAGHRSVDCTTRGEVCLQCKRAGRQHGHRGNAEECPIIWRMVRRVVERTRYDA